jgi:hypothetical protein
LNIIITLPSSEGTLQETISIDLVDWGARLIFKPLSQRLYLIEVYDFSKVQYVIRGHVINPSVAPNSLSTGASSGSMAARFDVVAALGPTFPGRLLDAPAVSSDRACYMTSYDGGCFLHTVPAAYAKTIARAHVDLPPQFEDGSHPELARMYIFSSSISLDELDKAAIPTNTVVANAPAGLSSADTATSGTAYDDFLPVSVIVLLRPPLALLEDYQPSDSSPVSNGTTPGSSSSAARSTKYAHASSTEPGSTSSWLSPSASVFPVLIVNLDGPEAERAVLRLGTSTVQDVISALGDPSSASAMPAVAPTAPGGKSVPPSYVYEYRSRGMEFHFDEATHVLFRVVLHSNLTNTPDFGRFDRCAYRIYNTYPSVGLPSLHVEESASAPDGVFSTDALRSSASSGYTVAGGAAMIAADGDTSRRTISHAMVVGRSSMASTNGTGKASTATSTMPNVASNEAIDGHNPRIYIGSSSNSVGTDATLREAPADGPAVDGFVTVPNGSPALNRLVSDNGGVFIDSLSTATHAHTVMADDWSYAASNFISIGAGTSNGIINSASTSTTTTSSSGGANPYNTAQLRSPPGCPLAPTYVGAALDARIFLEISRCGHLASVSII